jgi:hypothetical protein
MECWGDALKGQKKLSAPNSVSDPVLRYSSTPILHYSARPDSRMNTTKRMTTKRLVGPEDYTPNLGPACPRIFTVWLSCSILSGFFKTVTGLICRIRSRTSESG